MGHYEQTEVNEALGLFMGTPTERHLGHSEDHLALDGTGISSS